MEQCHCLEGSEPSHLIPITAVQRGGLSIFLMKKLKICEDGHSMVSQDLNLSPQYTSINHINHTVH